jgi:hypothetical protein
MQRLFQLYAECEHSVWNSYVRPDTSNGEFGSPTLRNRNYETVFYYRKKTTRIIRSHGGRGHAGGRSNCKARRSGTPYPAHSLARRDFTLSISACGHIGRWCLRWLIFTRRCSYLRLPPICVAPAGLYGILIPLLLAPSRIPMRLVTNSCWRFCFRARIPPLKSTVIL